ncbi:hypothetical protein ACFSNO_24845, partial [Streptomyces cirratus]
RAGRRARAGGHGGVALPEAAQPEEPQATGQWTFGTGAAAADWSQARRPCRAAPPLPGRRRRTTPP